MNLYKNSKIVYNNLTAQQSGGIVVTVIDLLFGGNLLILLGLMWYSVLLYWHKPDSYRALCYGSLTAAVVGFTILSLFAAWLPNRDLNGMAVVGAFMLSMGFWAFALLDRKIKPHARFGLVVAGLWLTASGYYFYHLFEARRFWPF